MIASTTFVHYVLIYVSVNLAMLLKCSKCLLAAPPVRYSPESEHIDDSVRPAGACSKPEQYPPTYEECEKYKPVYEPGTNNEQPLPPDTENPTIPSGSLFVYLFIRGDL